jgi:hypothetical protein
MIQWDQLFTRHMELLETAAVMQETTAIVHTANKSMNQLEDCRAQISGAGNKYYKSMLNPALRGKIFIGNIIISCPTTICAKNKNPPSDYKLIYKMLDSRSRLF